MPNPQVILPGRPIHPGPAPIGPPWWGHPDWCDCESHEVCPPNWSQDAIRCWNEMQQFRNMVAEIVQQELARGTTAIMGVTDGSKAKAGEVGEVIRLTAPFTFAGNPSVTNGNVAAGVIQPGDWDLSGFVSLTTQIGAFFINSTPAPPEFTDLMTANIFEAAPSPGAVAYTVLMNTVSASVPAPRLLNFAFSANQAGNAGFLAGTGNIVVICRRRR